MSLQQGEKVSRLSRLFVNSFDLEVICANADHESARSCRNNWVVRSLNTNKTGQVGLVQFWHPQVNGGGEGVRFFHISILQGLGGI